MRWGRARSTSLSACEDLLDMNTSPKGKDFPYLLLESHSLVTLPQSAQPVLLEIDLACPTLFRLCLWTSNLCNPEQQT